MNAELPELSRVKPVSEKPEWADGPLLRRRDGFTLVELLLVMTVMVAAIAVAGPSLANFFRGRTLDSEARRLLALTHAGKSRAGAEGVPMRLWVDGEGKKYDLKEEPGWDEQDPKEVEFALDKDLESGSGRSRLAILLAIGVLHACLLWYGDVLHVYAVLGLLLLLVMRHMSDRTIIGLIVLLLVYPAFSGVLRLLVVTPEITAMRVAQAQAFEASNNLAYGSGTFITAAREHMREFAHFYDDVWSLWGTFGFYVQMATTMLLGVLIGRHRLAQRIPELLPTLRRIQWWALGVGLVCALSFGIIFEIQRTPGHQWPRMVRG